MTLGQGNASDASINACVHRKTGALRITPPGRRCTRRERRLAWNRLGPAGPTGAPGAAGQPGGSGDGGQRGDKGVFRFDDFDGMACDDGQAGTIDLTYDGNGYARFEC